MCRRMNRPDAQFAKNLRRNGNAGFGTWFPAPVTLSLSENSSSSSSAQCAKSEELITWKLERLLFAGRTACGWRGAGVKIHKGCREVGRVVRVRRKTGCV